MLSITLLIILLGNNVIDLSLYISPNFKFSSHRQRSGGTPNNLDMERSE
jgi:hypothetical protein